MFFISKKKEKLSGISKSKGIFVKNYQNYKVTKKCVRSVAFFKGFCYNNMRGDFDKISRKEEAMKQMRKGANDLRLAKSLVCGSCAVKTYVQGIRASFFAYKNR